MSTRPQPDPDRGARFLRKLFAEDPAHLDVASDEEVVRQMDAAGITVKSVPTVDELMALVEKRAGVRSQAPARGVPAAPAPLRPRRLRAGPIAAGVALAAIGIAALMSRHAIEAYLRGEPIRPDQPWAPPVVPSTPEQRAASIRGEAFAACDARQWAECTAKLDEAAMLDPAGESDPRVATARKAAAEATRVPRVPEVDDGSKLK